MRLDRWLWWCRLTKTRAAAQALASQGRLRIDGRAIDRAHASVRVGQVVTFMQGGGDPQRARVRALAVVALPVRRGPAPEAGACYRDLLLEAARDGSAGRVDAPAPAA